MLSKRSLLTFLLCLTLLSGFMPLTIGPSIPTVQAATNTLTLNVISARTEPRAFGGAGVVQGDPITTFKYIINIDNTGTTTQRPDPTTGAPPVACTPADPGYPASCDWLSIAGAESNSPIYTQGDQSDFPLANLPDGRYLISVIADGYKLDGKHFTVPLADPGLVTVELQPFPLPDATIRAWVFEDISPTNSAPDAPIELGLPGFVGHIADYIGEVTTDVYGNPLCTLYVGEDPVTHIFNPGTLQPPDYAPEPIPGTGGACVSDANGDLVIPHVGPNRYALSAVKPDGTNWIQTTTLEGNHDWDAWVMEGATGLDTEFVVAGEPFPAIIFGFVKPTNALTGGTGQIEGVVTAFKTYVPGQGGVIGYDPIAGSKVDKPIDSPWISLNDLGAGDTAVWIGQGDANGAFTIPNVPAGNYTLTWWDEPQDYILNLTNVSVANGEVVDLGLLALNGWWTQLEGYVFNDLNRNGIRDSGEGGLSGFPVAMRKRENSLMDRGAVVVTTDATGYYFMENLYPMTQWLIVEAYTDLYYTTGVTYQADNQSTPTTILGAGVDVSILPIIGLGGRLDWGVHSYASLGGTPGIDPDNGGIVGTVSYDTTRNEIDPRYAAVEPWQPGVPDLTVNLYAPVDCGTNAGAPCDASGRYELDNTMDGAFSKGAWLNTAVTETWERPGTNNNANEDGRCVPRDVNGDPLLYPADQQVTAQGLLDLPVDPALATDCLEGPLMGVQFQAGFSSVDGNYGFGEGCFNGTLDATDPANPVCVGGSFEPLAVGDYLVEVAIPNDATGRPLYQVTKEEDINIANGDQFIPQIPPPECAGPLHTVDVATIGTDIFPAQYNELAVYNAATGGTFTLSFNGQTTAAIAFNATATAIQAALESLSNIKTVDVTGTGTASDPWIVSFVDPVVGWLTADDANLTGGTSTISPSAGATLTVPESTPVDNATFAAELNGSYYEGQPKPLCSTKLVPVSNGRSVAPLFNVFTDVPLPGRFWGLIVDDLNFSSNPKSLLYGEKAGVPFAPVGIYDWTNRLITTLESDYNGLWDVLLPSSNRINCPTPSGVCANLYRAVGNDPGIPGRLNLNYKPQFRTIAAEFESIPGLIVPADLAPTQVGMTVQLPGGQFNWVACTVNDPTTAPTKPELLAVSQPYANVSNNTSRSFTIIGQGFGATKGSGQVTLDGVALPTGSWTDTQIVATVPGSTPGGPQQLKITAANGQSTVNGLTFHVIKTTGANSQRYNPNVYEVGPGRPYAVIQAAIDAAAASNGDDLVVVYPGTPDFSNPRYNPRGAYYENLIIAAPVKLQGVGPGGFQGTTFVPGSIIDGSAFGGDTALADAWRARALALQANPGWLGNQTISEGEVIFMVATSATQYGPGFKAAIDGFSLRGGDQQGQANLITQGGAIFANAYVRNLQITNNEIVGNSSSYGTVRIGTPDLTPVASNFNENLRIANNRIIQNGGTNLAGGIALFAGADNYEVAGNDICGNFSAEYGGGMTAYGLSPNGKIHDNRIYFNESYDEGGGIMIAGELPANPLSLSPGSGPVNIYNNLIQNNMANDDGGGLRFLMAGNFPMNVYNNMIVNNISTHEGGGIGINDAPNVRVYNNTIMKNLTTATAITSLGFPAPAGLSTSANSDLLQATLPGGVANCGTGTNAPCFSNPLLFNNIFWDNRAGTRGGGTVTGLGAPGDTTPINYWDLGVADGTGTLSSTNSIIQSGDGAPMGSDPLVVSAYDVAVTFAAWRNNPAFIGAIMITNDLPPNLLGNYHLGGTGSPAYNLGAASKAVPAYQQPPASIAAPAFDIDNEPRPALGGFDAGADEYPGPLANLSISKTDGVDSVAPGAAVQYSIVVANAGPLGVTGATVTDNVPAALTGATWTCTASFGSTCAASGSGSINTTVSLLPGGSATFTLNGTVSGSGTLVNTATVAAPAGTTDPNPADNSATDTDAIAVPLPNLTLLDNFNRGNSNAGLGANWSQPNSNIRLNNNNAQENTGTTGFAYWNGTTGGGPTYGAQQGAAFTMVNGTIVSGANGNSLILKASGGTATAPQSYIRVRLTASTVVVETTVNSGGAFTLRGTLAATFGNGNTLTAVANADGSVDVWQNTAYVGRVTGTTFTGTGRIGMMLINGARVDNFSGGTLP